MSTKLLGDRRLELKDGGPIVREVLEILALGCDIRAERVEVVGEADGALVVLKSRDVERAFGALQEPAAFAPRPLHALNEPSLGDEARESGADVVDDLRGRLRLLEVTGVEL